MVSSEVIQEQEMVPIRRDYPPEFEKGQYVFQEQDALHPKRSAKAFFHNKIFHYGDALHYIPQAKNLDLSEDLLRNGFVA